MVIASEAGGVFGIEIDRWVHREGSPSCPMCEINIPVGVWRPEGFYGTRGLDWLFPSFRDYVDAVSTTDGFSDWMERLNTGGTGYWLCAACPPPSNRRFCPEAFIYEQDPPGSGNYTGKYANTCLGQAFKNMEDTSRDTTFLFCMGGASAQGLTLALSIKAGKCLRLTAPPLVKICLAALGIGTAATAAYCWWQRKRHIEKQFESLNNAWQMAVRDYCDNGEVCLPTP